MTPSPDGASWHPLDEVVRMGVRVRHVCMTGGVLGLCDWQYGIIYLRDDLTTAQELCALTHELLHLRRGPLSLATPLSRLREERAISSEVARLLVPLERLAWALPRTDNLAELADELGVDRYTVRTRIEGLNPMEARYVRSLMPCQEEAA